MSAGALKQSNEEIILSHFKRGWKLTVVKCLEKYGTIELRHYVARLRKRGFNIVGTWTTNKTGDKRFKVFQLKK